LPFIELIEGELDVLALNGPLDYRLHRLAGIGTWHTPLGAEATEQVREVFFRLTDYLPVAQAYKAVIVVGIPIMDPEMRNESARFVTLVDALYENNVKLFATAAAEPEAL